MSDARRAILDRVDRALRTARIPQTESPAVSPANREVVAPDRALLQQRFLTEAGALGIETFVEESVEAVRKRLAAIVDGRRILSWSPERLPYGAGAAVANAITGSASHQAQAEADIGVTGCDGALAETGSLVLLSGPGTPRTVSLLPPVHVAIVRPEDLTMSMGDFFAANRDRMAQASSCTIVTGPSRTADIELSLTIGVHGPGRVIVIVGP